MPVALLFILFLPLQHFLSVSSELCTEYGHELFIIFPPKVHDEVLLAGGSGGLAPGKPYLRHMTYEKVDVILRIWVFSAGEGSHPRQPPTPPLFLVQG